MKKKMIPTKDRPTRPITIRMPVDVLEDLKRVAPTKDLPGYQSLIKFYIRQGLRLDLERLWETEEKSRKLDAVLTEIGLKKEEKSKIWEALGGEHPRTENA
ncbi:MAG: hypothetical protein WBG50_03510 [Desulfomonilaceae bacterium]